MLNSFSGDVRRRVAYGVQAGATSLKVPVYANPEGDYREGRFDVPLRLAGTKPDTNERHEFERVTEQMFKRWTGWLEKRGWEYVPQTLQVSGPFQKPTPNTWTEGDEEVREYHLLARFKRTTPLFVGLDDFLELRDMQETYGVGENPMPWDTLKGEDSGWVNPMEYAENRRKRTGLKREDFLLGPLDEPL